MIGKLGHIILLGFISVNLLSTTINIEIARFTDDGFVEISKWADTGSEIVETIDDVLINDEFTDALELIKRSNGQLGWRLAFREGLERDAEIVNKYFIQYLESDNPPYKILTKVKDLNLGKGKFYIVENKFQDFPGSWGSTFKVNSIDELRNKLAVLKDWKKVKVLSDGSVDGLVVREYEVIEKIPARDGFIGRQIDVDGSEYEGGKQQYEFLIKGIELKQKLRLVSETPIE